MKKIADDIYRLTLPLPFYGVKEMNLYYIDGDKPAIIDTGLGDSHSFERLSSELIKINRSIKNISTIINTHEHIEHFGGNRLIREASQGMVTASVPASYKIRNSQKINMDLKKYLSDYEPDLAAELKAELDFDLKIEGSEVDCIVDDGDIIDTGSIRLRVLTTPGHAAGHICLYNADRKILFTGDHIIARTSTFVGYDYREIASQRIVDVFNNGFAKPDNLTLYINSINKLQRLSIDVILPGHGDIITNPYKKLEMEIGKKERRSRMFLEVLEKRNEISLKELTAEVYGKKNNTLLHRGSALGYLARLNRSGIIEAEMRKDDLYLKMKIIDYKK